MVIRRLATAVICVFALWSQSDADFDFTPVFPTTVYVPWAESHFVADIDGDGHLDFVITSGSQVTSFLGDGEGGFTETSQLVDIGFSGLGDVDGDGYLDFVSGSIDGATLYLNDTAGEFVFHSVISTEYDLRRFDLADYDNDGVVDVLAMTSASVANRIDFFRGNPDLTFDAPVSIPLSSSGTRLLPADLNGDSYRDIVCVLSDNSFRVYLGSESGPFTLSDTGVGSVHGPADFNGDGHEDLFHIAAGMLWLHPGSGDGLFGAPVATSSGMPFGSSSWTDLRVVDLDHDGALDFVLNNGGLKFYLGDGEGGFTLVHEEVGLYYNLAQPSDFDGNGAFDLAAIRCDSMSPALHLSLSATIFRRGDLDGDGELFISDAIHGLDALFGDATLACEDAADTNDDSVVDLADMVFLVTYLFIDGDAPPAPGPTSCRCDPTPDLLDCESGCL